MHARGGLAAVRGAYVVIVDDYAWVPRNTYIYMCICIYLHIHIQIHTLGGAYVAIVDYYTWVHGR